MKLNCLLCGKKTWVRKGVNRKKDIENEVRYSFSPIEPGQPEIREEHFNSGGPVSLSPPGLKNSQCAKISYNGKYAHLGT